EGDKRTQVISYLNAQEADAAGLTKYIENYALNQFSLTACTPAVESEVSGISGLTGYYFPNNKLQGAPVHVEQDSVNFNWGSSGTVVSGLASHDNFSVRWIGRL